MKKIVHTLLFALLSNPTWAITLENGANIKKGKLTYYITTDDGSINQQGDLPPLDNYIIDMRGVFEEIQHDIIHGHHPMASVAFKISGVYFDVEKSTRIPCLTT